MNLFTPGAYNIKAKLTKYNNTTRLLNIKQH